MIVPYLFRLRSLSMEERFRIFSIKDSWLAVAFTKLYTRWTDSKDNIFALILAENEKLEL